MASLKINGVRHQSGSGAHSSKSNVPRERTRSAVKNKAISQGMDVPVAKGSRAHKLDTRER